jgi:hypothetical protein
MIDENLTPSDKYPARLYFHCPNTNCDGHVRLGDRSRYHAIKCEKCSLEFAIGADPELRKSDLLGVHLWAVFHSIPAWLLFFLGLCLGLWVVCLPTQSDEDWRRMSVPIDTAAWIWTKAVLISAFGILTATSGIMMPLGKAIRTRKAFSIGELVSLDAGLADSFPLGLIAEVVPRLLFALLEIIVNHELRFRPVLIS